MNVLGYWDYNEDSPSCLRWAGGVHGNGRGSGERVSGSVAGSKQTGRYEGWAVQVSINGTRYRRSARRVVWEKFNGPVPTGYVIVSGNGDGFDNRISNLVCIDTFALSLWKMWRSKRSTVFETYTGLFIAQTKDHGRYIHISTHRTKEDAHTAYRNYIRSILEQTDLKEHLANF
ncbi:MAG: HNH endonuclease signature motif containing protein [Fusobacteriaceae bacterium]